MRKSHVFTTGCWPMHQGESLNPDYEIVRYTPDFRKQILRLQTNLWGDDLSRNDAYFRWKYEINPYHDRPTFHIALYRDVVVGMRGLIGSLWEVNQKGQTYRWLAQADSIVDPEHRRNGIFSRISAAEIAHQSNSEFDFVINLSTGPMSTSGNLRMGWRSPGGSLAAVRAAAQPKVFAGRRRHALAQRFPALHKIYRHVRDRASNPRQMTTSPCDPFEAVDRKFAERYAQSSQFMLSRQPRPFAMSSLVDQLDYDGRARHIRDERYFTWRFANPRSDYRFLFCGRNDLSGYLVLRASRVSHGASLDVLDMEAVDQGTWSELLDVLSVCGNANYLSLWATTLSHGERTVLQRAGFQVIEQRVGPELNTCRPSVLIRPLKGAGSDSDWCVGQRSLLSLENWDLRALYADGF